MSNYNTNVCIFTGNVTRDPVISYTQADQSAIAKFSLAVNQGDKASFFDFTAFKKTAEIIQQWVKKGSKLLVNARAQQETWKNKETGKAMYAIRFIVNSIEFIGAKQDAVQQPATPVPQAPAPVQSDNAPVPFDPPGSVDTFDFPQSDDGVDPFAE